MICHTIYKLKLSDFLSVKTMFIVQSFVTDSQLLLSELS